MTDNLFALFRRCFPADLSRPFLETADGTRFEYGDVLAGSGRFARVLVQDGVRPGDRVAACVEKSPQALVLYLACLRAGAVFLPLNPASTTSEVRYVLRDAAPAVFVSGRHEAAAMNGVAAELGVPCVETLDENGGGTLVDKSRGVSAAFADAVRAADDLAAILYTSGTTGRPKGAMLTHDNLASNALVLKEAWRFSDADRLLHVLPIFHAHGLFVAINVTLLAGASMIFLPRFDAEAVIRLLPRATVMMGVPTFYTRLLSRPAFDRSCAGTMRLFISGSAPLSAETHRAFRERTGHAILERYGMTETLMNTSNPYEGERIAGTVGPPLPGVEIRIADPQTGAPLADGTVGMIEIRGRNVFAGYWRMPGQTASAFRPDGFFISGDLGFRDAKGYVTIVGREKDLIISGGLNVYPKEVESAIHALPGVADVAVIGVPHADFGEAVMAVVVPERGRRLDPEAIQAALATELANYKLPKRIVFAEALPRNAMGKVQKNALRQQYRDIFAAT